MVEVCLPVKHSQESTSSHHNITIITCLLLDSTMKLPSLPCIEQDTGHELCFLSNLNHDRRVGCNILGDIFMTPNWAGWEVWRFIRDESSGHYILSLRGHIIRESYVLHRMDVSIPLRTRKGVGRGGGSCHRRIPSRKD